MKNELTPARIDELVTEAETNEAAFEARCQKARKACLDAIEDAEIETRNLREQIALLDKHCRDIRRAAREQRWLDMPRGVLSREDIEVFCCVSPAGLLDSEDD